MDKHSSIEIRKNFIKTTVGETETIATEKAISISAPSIIIHKSDRREN